MSCVYGLLFVCLVVADWAYIYTIFEYSTCTIIDESSNTYVPDGSGYGENRPMCTEH